MSKFRCQWSEDIKVRTVESPEGPYKVCLEGYFDFNEALLKLMIANGNMLPNSSQYEPDSDSDNESDMDFVEPQFDDVCDAIQEAYNLSKKFSASLDYVKGKDDDESSSKPKIESTDPVKEVVE